MCFAEWEGKTFSFLINGSRLITRGHLCTRELHFGEGRHEVFELSDTQSDELCCDIIFHSIFQLCKLLNVHIAIDEGADQKFGELYEVSGQKCTT